MYLRERLENIYLAQEFRKKQTKTENILWQYLRNRKTLNLKFRRQFVFGGFKNKESFYKYTCGLIFENAKDKLNNAIVIIDESGSNGFKTSLQKYLKTKINKKDCNNIIKKVKMENSKSNNLLQIADYVSGIIAKSISKKNNKINFRDKIKKREIFVQTWPI